MRPEHSSMIRYYGVLGSNLFQGTNYPVWGWTVISSEMLRHVVQWNATAVSEEDFASGFKVEK
jgi:hypothetical protein